MMGILNTTIVGAADEGDAVNYLVDRLTGIVGEDRLDGISVTSVKPDGEDFVFSLLGDLELMADIAAGLEMAAAH